MKIAYTIYSRSEAKRNKEFIKILVDSFKELSIELKLLIEDDIEIKYEDTKSTECEADNNSNKNDVTTNKKLFYCSTALEKPEFVLQRVMNYKLTEDLESLRIKVINNSKVNWLADNKFNTYNEAKRLSIPVLDTYLISRNKLKNFPIFYPNVTKPLDSKGGNNVFYNKNKEEFEENIKVFEDEDFLIQKPADIIGKDLRVYVIGNKIILPMLRESNSGFRSNYGLGGSAKVTEINNEIKTILETLFENYYFDYVGIDFLFNNDGPVLSEIESVVGARSVYALTDLNIGKMAAEHVANIIAKTNNKK